MSLKAVLAVAAMVLTRNKHHLIWYLGVGFRYLGSVLEGGVGVRGLEREEIRTLGEKQTNTT